MKITLRPVVVKHIFFSAVVFAFFAAKADGVAPVYRLKCEHLINPLGIDAARPRFTWMMADARLGARQTAFQVAVSTDSLALNNGRATYWQTAIIKSADNQLPYSGKTLNPFTKYYWQITLWDKDGKKMKPSAIASFETGMMQMTNWKGSWISDDKDIHVNPAPYFRHQFIAGKKIRSARAYIAAAGLYELYINGQKIGDHRLDPMYTRFDRRTLYVTYDVTAQLQAGYNAIGVLLGNGWYNHQSTAVWLFHQAPWRGRPTFCLDVRITYEDGSVETVTSDTNWKTSLSPITFNSIYTAEHYDARLEQPGWNTTKFNESKWSDIVLRSAPSKNIVAQAMQPIRGVEEIPAKSITKLEDNVYVFDIGRNIAGVSKITVTGAAGTVVRLKHAERLNKAGHADQSNIDIHYRPTDDKDPFQTDIFILKGRGEETFMSRFNYKGFQYVEVSSDKPIAIQKESLSGVFMHSDVTAAGHIESSNPIINKIWSATNNSYLSNLFGYPTDCPQREKNGWTGDAHIASETGLYNFDGITVYEKWMADHRDEQQPNGVLPSIVPTGGWGYEWGNGPDWTSTIAIIPYNLYLFYGDSKALTDNYSNIKRYVDHIDELYPTGLTTWGLGDWVPVKSKTPVELTSSVYYFVDADILAKAAKLLNNKTDQLKYTALAEKIKSAINIKYLNVATGVYDKGYQTEMSVPLYWGIVPDGLKSKVAGNLAKTVAADNFHLDVGLLGTKAILNALSDNGYADVAYRIASQEDYPSWGWWMVNGATTLYENWKIDAKSDISLNHIMFGQVGAWLYSGPGGIKPDPQNPGFKNVLIEPDFVEGLAQFSAEHDGPYGKITSSWKKDGSKVFYDMVIPANSTGTVLLPVGNITMNGAPVKTLITTKGKTQLQLPAGKYQFVIN